jgi:hypothetical protein
VSHTVLGALLALLAAVALNGSYLMQHAGSPPALAVSARRPLATLAGLLRSPLWTAGAAVGITGWALHIGAMREAPLSLVQAFVAGGLALAAPMAALGLRRRLSGPERQAVAAMALALALLAVGLPQDPARVPAAGVLAAVAAALIAAAGALALRARGPLALALAGGLLYGTADLCLKAAAGAHSLAAAATAPWAYVGLAATAGAFFAFQRALQGDRPIAVIALMTAATNVSSILGAFAAYGDPLGRTPALAAAHALAFVLVVAAATRLAPAAGAFDAA